MKNQTLYKALRQNLKSHYGKKKWKVGAWYKCKGGLEMCKNGFHASERIIDSMGYVPLENLCLVEVRGDNKKQDDKQCWREMKIIKAWRWKKEDSVALSIYASSLALANFEKRYPEDKRPRKAIQATRRWLKNSTKKNESAARSAAESAESAESAAWSTAESAARSAESAAEPAARSVWSARSAWSAARSAARSAAWSAWSTARSTAWSAVWSAVLDKIEKWIRRRIKKLEIIGE